MNKMSGLHTQTHHSVKKRKLILKETKQIGHLPIIIKNFQELH